ncbi:MAG: TrmH family RNA methyltransferase [Desulfomonilia bacterium]|nr:TrmH family RNA methyltransferase [Deltaproteobacteria bacterium]HRS57024.1 TrmH family RNA methyltransferase [Desulfomonilia bacterium]
MKEIIRHCIRECTEPACAMRFPVVARSGAGLRCPLCGSPTRQATGEYEEHGVTATLKDKGNTRIEAFLDNIRSLYNVGSMFRSADGAGIGHLYLCGMTPTPDNPRLAKTALGAQNTVPWTYRRNGLSAAVSLRESGRRLWALEGGPSSVPLMEALPDLSGPTLVLVVGNEVSGVDPAILELCERIVHIPMRGAKSCLNAAVAFGIAAYQLCAPGLKGNTG